MFEAFLGLAGAVGESAYSFPPPSMNDVVDLPCIFLMGLVDVFGASKGPCRGWRETRLLIAFAPPLFPSCSAAGFAQLFSLPWHFLVADSDFVAWKGAILMQAFKCIYFGEDM